MSLVRARVSHWVSSSRLIRAGDLLDDTDPAVQRAPDQFEPVVATSRPVEEATAAPGQKRKATKKTAKKTAKKTEPAEPAEGDG